MTRTASPKQLAFIDSLTEERQPQEADLTYYIDRLAEIDEGTLSSTDASELIDMLLGSPRKERRALTPGVYERDGEVFLVVHSKAGRPYAKEALHTRSEGWFWEYMPGAISKLRPEHRMSAEKAAAFGRRTSHCCNCLTELTNPVSVRLGYGPVCASNNGWPYGETVDVPTAPETTEPSAEADENAADYLEPEERGAYLRPDEEDWIGADDLDGAF